MDDKLIHTIAGALSGKSISEAAGSTPELTEFPIDDLMVVGPASAPKPQKSEGGGGGGGDEDGDEDEDEDEELDTHIPGDEGDEDIDEPTEEELEAHGKKARDQLQKREEGAKNPDKNADTKTAKADKGGPGAHTSLEPRAVDWSAIRPRYNWKSLLEKLVRSTDTTEVTYQKVHRRNITSVHVATQTGAGVIRPGEREVPANLVKLCIVVDSSGSMHEAIKKVLANVTTLLNQNAAGISKQFAFVEFSGNFRIYACTISGKFGSAVKISGVEGMGSAGSGERVDLATLLARHEGGGTNFDGALVAKLKEFIAKKYNVLILTDTDILNGSNAEHFMDLYSTNHQQTYVLFDSKKSFTYAVTQLKQASANFSHL